MAATGFGAGPASLAPHPWDTFGKPPALGGTYPEVAAIEGRLPADVVEDALRAAELLRGVDEAREEIEELEAEARDGERRANEILARLGEYPRLVLAIQDDPAAILDADDCAEAAHDPRRADA